LLRIARCPLLWRGSVVSDPGELNLHDRVGCCFFCMAHACGYVLALCLSHLTWMDGCALIGHSLFFGRVEGMHLHALTCGCDCLEIHLLAAIVDFSSWLWLCFGHLSPSLPLSQLGVCYSILAVVADSSFSGLQPALMITGLVVLQSSF
jgi:hypothetical protein